VLRLSLVLRARAPGSRRRQAELLAGHRHGGGSSAHSMTIRCLVVGVTVTYQRWRMAAGI
jgi:hypothetical protein